MDLLNIDGGETLHLTSRREVAAVLNDLKIDLLILIKKIRKLFSEELSSLTSGLRGAFRDLRKMLKAAFSVTTLEEYTQAASIYGSQLAAALYQLQLSFAGLKTAVIRAVAPLAELLVPVVQAAVQWLTALANTIGYVFRMLTGTSQQTEELTSGLVSTAGAASTLKRSLAGFDQINRLSKNSGGGVSVGGLPELNDTFQLSGKWKKLADKLLELFEPLGKIDLTPAAESLTRFRQALAPITKALFAGLEWAWYNILVPLAQWTAEELLPVFLDTLAATLEALNIVIGELKPHFQWLWEECLQPLIRWKTSQLIGDMQTFAQSLQGMNGWLGTNQPLVEQWIASGKKWIYTIGDMIGAHVSLGETLDWAGESFSNVLQYFLVSCTPIGNVTTAAELLTRAVGMLSDGLSALGVEGAGVWNTLKDICENGWQTLKSRLFDPIKNGTRELINNTIGLFNGFLGGAAKGVNFLTKSMNAMSFTIPSWVPDLGGKAFQFAAAAVTAPKIPFLAEGAVLPANKPFMAVVGDQRHGTNVEAPLGVIQQAVAEAMADYTQSNLAGHTATVNTLQEILSAVLGIHLGDDMIAGAVDRYNRKMAVVRGGYL